MSIIYNMFIFYFFAFKIGYKVYVHFNIFLIVYFLISFCKKNTLMYFANSDPFCPSTVPVLPRGTGQNRLFAS